MNKEQYEKRLIDDIVSSILKNGGENLLTSVVLTGSFGRGEPTYTIKDNGEVQLKSDVEIALIYSKYIAKSEIVNLINTVSSEFDEDLNMMPITEKRIINAHNFNFSFKEPKYKTIFTFDLYNGSYTVWGHDYIKQKKVLLNEIDIYEAKRIVANRIAELNYLLNTTKSIESEYLRMQWKSKVILSIGSAWLLCEGKYSSSYKKQLLEIEREKESVEKLFGNEFINEYNKVFKFLRENGEHYEVNNIKLQLYLKQISKLFNDKKLEKVKVNSFSRIIKYYIKYFSTGMKYGVIGFENKILNEIIEGYCNEKNILKVTKVWSRVLY